MLRNLDDILGFNVKGTDDDIGKVDDFYFDDEYWVIRYIVVDIGGWLSDKRVLISPEALKQPDWGSEVFPVSLTKEQIEKSPDVDTDKPVSRQHEKELNAYYDWAVYWTAYSPTEAPIIAVPPLQSVKREASKIEKEQTADEDTHLRSMKEVLSYKICAIDNNIGHTDAFIVDDESWKIRYLVIDIRNWFLGKKVIVSPEWIKTIDWHNMEVKVNLSKKSIENSPEYDPEAPINRDYENRLYDFYGKRKYWTEEMIQESKK